MRRDLPRTWLGLLLLVAGVVSLAIGLLNVARLLAAPLDAQRGYLAQAVLPLIGGLWLVIGGLYALTHRGD